MALNITQSAQIASEGSNINPQVVFVIDGVVTKFSAVGLKKFILVGENGLFVGDSWVIGGLSLIEDNSPYISFQKGTTTQLKQTLNIDKGKGETISSMQIALIDKNEEVSNLITPGQVVTDVLGRSAKVYFGFENTAFPDDYSIIHQGIIESIKSRPGLVTLNVNAADNKKKSSLFEQVETDLTASITSGSTVANVTSTTDFLQKVVGPDLVTTDSALRTYIRIDDEIIEYQTKTTTQFQTLTRGTLGTTAASHSSGARVSNVTRLVGNILEDISLKLMLSGSGDYVSAQSVTNFNRVDLTTVVSNTVVFEDIDLEKEHNVITGDYVTITGTTNGSNNVTAKIITNVVKNAFGTYLEIGGVTFVEEINSTAVISIRSKYDVWPEGFSMNPNEVDIQEFNLIYQRFLSSFSMDFYLQDSIEGKTWITENVLNPASCFNIPRKAKTSIGIHIGPLPGTNIKTLDASNVINVSNIEDKRSISKNFYNTNVYRYDKDPITDKTLAGEVRLDATSLSQIPVGVQKLQIEAEGMRTSLQALSLAQQASNRRLRKYKFGAEYFDLKVLFGVGFDLEIGDIVLVDFASLKLTDIKNGGTRAGEPRLMQIDNKSLDMRNGNINLSVVDTNFSNDTRYGLISPSSYIKTGISTTQFNIEASFNTDKYGANEYKKWKNYVGASVIIRNADHSISEVSTISSIVGNLITLGTALSFTPPSNSTYLMELDVYANQTSNVKLIYAFMSNTVFADGGIQYQML